MTDYDPCLAGCDHALAEAELLIARLAVDTTALNPELDAFADRIATLRREVNRLRGLPTVRVRKPKDPDWNALVHGAAPWPAGPANVAGGA
jgi:hypothetical protein